MPGGLRSLGGDWLGGAPRTEALLPPALVDEPDRAAASAVAAQRRPHPGVIRALETEPANRRPEARGGLDALVAGEAVVVVTGQQAGFLGGPLYTFHKAMSAVAMAESLSLAQGRPHVALFWVQDEDHDFAEVAQASWLNEAGLVTDGAAPDQTRIPVGERAVDADAARAAERAVGDHRDSPYADELQAFCRPWAEVGAGWSDAFVRSLLSLLGPVPLLFLRGRSRELARAAALTHRRVLAMDAEVEAALVEGAEAVRAAGFRVQVAVRRGCTLAFHHPDGEGGARHRLDRCPDGFLLPEGRPVSREALLERLDRDPLSFSTSALLRPLVQDRLLPAAFQVVGPGEAAYLGQLGPLRALLGVPASRPVPRGRGRWIEPAIRRRLEALRLSADEACGDPTRILAERGPAHLSPERLRSRLLEPLLERLDALEAEGLDPRLVPALDRTRVSVARNLSRFVGRAARVAAEQDAVSARRLAEVRRALLPGGCPQERFLSVVGLLARYGAARLRQVFLETYRPFGTAPMELRP